MFGKNPIRPPVANDDGQNLQIVEIFPTLQGEGPFTGHPAVFVRLGGCNLACMFCDTEFEQFTARPLKQVVEEVENLSLEHHERVRRLVVITGGEPFRQNIGPLCEQLQMRGFTVQVETNGTLWRAVPEGVHIVCSPKASNGQYHTLRPDLLERVDALKFIISESRDEYQDVGEVGQNGRDIPVYVQPMDEYDANKNAANLARAAMLAQRDGYFLSLQTHKIMGIP
jgi:organic radical activating enzyme